MKATTFFAALGMLAPLCQAAIPAHFSERAKEILADEVAVVPAEHPLNIVYFLGNDNEPSVDYERRLSEIMLFVQQFYAKEMTRNGYAGRSFGMERLENGNVKLHVVRGKHSHREYVYGTGHGKCLEDIHEWAKANPGSLKSDHILVIMPTFQDEHNNDMSPGGVPFYGLGRNCFALDYANFDLRHLGQDTREGHLLTKWLGGLAHELGHGLNLPHNEGTVSEKAALGTPLMGAGNYTLGMKPTYLTLNSARLLDRCQVFAPAGDKTDFYVECPAPQVVMSSLKWEGDALKLVVVCKDVTYVNALVQDPGYFVNQDYDAVAFCATEESNNAGLKRFTLTMPLAELAARQNTGKGEQSIDILLTQPNGNRYRWRTIFDWSKLKQGDAIPMEDPKKMNLGY